METGLNCHLCCPLTAYKVKLINVKSHPFTGYCIHYSERFLFQHYCVFITRLDTDEVHGSESGETPTSVVDAPPQYDEVCGASDSVTDSTLPSYTEYIRSLPHVVVVVDVTPHQRMNSTPSSLSSPSTLPSSSPSSLPTLSSSSSAAAAAAVAALPSQRQDYVINAETSEQSAWTLYFNWDNFTRWYISSTPGHFTFAGQVVYTRIPSSIIWYGGDALRLER